MHLSFAVLAVSPQLLVHPQSPHWWVRSRKGLDSLQALLSNKENMPVLLTLPAAQIQHSPTLAALKKLPQPKPAQLGFSANSRNLGLDPREAGNGSWEKVSSSTRNTHVGRILLEKQTGQDVIYPGHWYLEREEKGMPANFHRFSFTRKELTVTALWSNVNR